MNNTPLPRCALLSALGALVLSSTQVLFGQAAAPAPFNAPAPPPAEEKKTGWETSAALGLTLTRGNSKTLLFTGNVLSEKKWTQNEIRLGIDGSYGEDNDIKNTENIHGFAQYNRLFTERFYGYLRADALHDAIADVEYRVALSPGVGYYFIKNETTTFSGEVGPGVVFEKQGNDEKTYFTVRIAERAEHKLNDRVKLWESVEYLPQVDDWDNYILNSEIGIDTAITKKFFLTVFAQDTYDNRPAPGRDKNDLKLVAGIKYKF